MRLLLRNLLLVCLVFVACTSIAQPPPVINSTAVALDPLGNVAKNRDIYVKDIIYQTSPNGTRVWEESHIIKSNNDGVFTFPIGQGTKAAGINIADIGQIDWGSGPFFLNVKIAVAPSIPAAWWVAADNYLDQGTSQMMSVPYALFAGNATVTNVNTNIQPGPPSTFLITDSLGNVTWGKPQAASQVVTNIANFSLNLAVSTGQSVIIPALTTAVVSVNMPNAAKGDPVLVTPQDDYQNWAVYSAWVAQDGIVKIRFANYTDADVTVLGSQYKIVILKQ